MKPVLVIGLLFLAFAVAGGYVVTAIDRPLLLDESSAVYEVVPGMTLTGLGHDLAGKEMLPLPEIVFRVYARATQHEGVMKAGEYQLHSGISASELLALVRSGKVIQRQVTFIEGWTFAEWRRELASQQGITQSLATTPDPRIMALLGKGSLHPEGQFFPDTYQYTRGETDLAILRRAHQRMIGSLERAWKRRTPNNVLNSPYDTLILASIVEKETGVESDRARIAGVFVNRLVKEMRLQSDPTVIYGIRDFDGDITRKHLVTDTPYNTYTIRGLPPTPICNPGLASILATLNPEVHNYYYFVSRGDGTSEFSETLEAHNQAVNRYQKSGRVSR